MTAAGGKVIAIDGMGGDGAPDSVLRGLSAHSSSMFHFMIFGDELLLKKSEHLISGSGLSYEIRHAKMTITSDMDVMSSLRAGKQSSMGLAIQSVRDGDASAVISSGNTGLYMALSKMLLGTIDGIDRPAIASVIPGQNGRAVCLDLGANAECDVKNMVDFAILGEAISRSMLDRPDVKVALLNIGSEDIKGSRLVKKTSEILRNLMENYVGFVEGDDFGKGDVDVIVTDGFTGNVALKTIEGTAKFIASELKDALSDSILSKIGALLAANSLSRLKSRLDPRLYNGAILAGLNGVVVKSHGNSDEVGFATAIKFTMDILKNNIFDRIAKQISRANLSCSHDSSLDGDNKK